MARINGSANGNGNGKYPARASLGEVSQGEVPLGYNLNGEDDEIFDVTESKRMGHTRNDQKDMSRMGKRQELIVSLLYTHTSHTHTHLFFFFLGGRKKKLFFPPIFFCAFESYNSLMPFSYQKKTRGIFVHYRP